MEKSQRNIFRTSVAVIGGAGFLGSHLVEHLIEERECNVVVLDNLITGRKEFVHPEAKFIWCDITHSEDEMYRIFLDNNVEYVFNYAAEPYIPVSFERPLHVFDINARGALMAMNAAQRAGVKGFLQISSAEIYGDAPDHPINEDYPARPHSTYGASKLAIDALVQARWRESKMPAIALRQFNCLGERETHPYVITTIIEQISKKNTISLGNNSFRDFQYAGDAVRMAVELLEKGKFGEVYNMGSEDGIKIYDLAYLVGEIMEKEITVTEDESRKRPWEIWHLQSDNSKLYSVIEYRPMTSLTRALEKVVKYYKSNGWKFNE